MGSLVFAGAMSHAPGIAAFTSAAEEGQRQRFFAAVEQAREQLAQARPDVLVVIAPDHFANFFIDNMPAACVTTAESYVGPIEDWLGMPKTRIPGAPALARSILARAFANDIEPAFSESVELDHGVMVALKLLTPDLDIPIVWIMQNCQVPPLMSLKRCYALGRAVREAIDASTLRVAVVGTGGLSHAPGAAEADQLDPAFDRHFLSLLDQNAIPEVLALTNERIDAAGFGAWEIRQWVTALGVAHDRKPRTLAYEDIHAWDTGCAVALYE
ncbi:DODA-type extradiol aromatic ring-opening family dioxygenase [Lacisediminimonas profundi]|uniref:DODA-type extradiol aromatic ring-opening family dioxygenase n=1 Tax=Lacisediminimonas profundi TaxID=2603856 RepID=UPI00124B2C82|nr:extradiol ring-cleavage dioxygenase [Lacisediminimonas profundi]